MARDVFLPGGCGRSQGASRLSGAALPGSPELHLAVAQLVTITVLSSSPGSQLLCDLYFRKAEKELRVTYVI